MSGLVLGCTRVGDSDSDARRAAGEPTATYARRIFFVGGAEATPTIILFDHSVLAGATEEERNAGLWRATETGWQSLLDLRWSGTPIREPWRLVPHGPLRIMVDDAGEVEALQGRGLTDDFLLARVANLGEWSRDDPALYRIDLGEWRLGADSIPGLLIDVHPGTNGIDSGQASTELVLTDGAEFRLIATMPAPTEASESGELWLQLNERQETMAGVLVGRDTLPDTETWRIYIRSGELHGEFLLLGAPLLLDGGAAIQALRGWIEVRGERRAIFGAMRRVAA